MTVLFLPDIVPLKSGEINSSLLTYSPATAEGKVLSEVEIYSGSIIKMGRVEMRVEMS